MYLEFITNSQYLKFIHVLLLHCIPVIKYCSIFITLPGNVATLQGSRTSID